MLSRFHFKICQHFGICGPNEAFLLIKTVIENLFRYLTIIVNYKEMSSIKASSISFKMSKNPLSKFHFKICQHFGICSPNEATMKPRIWNNKVNDWHYETFVLRCTNRRYCHHTWTLEEFCLCAPHPSPSPLPTSILSFFFSRTNKWKRNLCRELRNFLFIFALFFEFAKWNKL